MAEGGEWQESLWWMGDCVRGSQILPGSLRTACPIVQVQEGYTTAQHGAGAGAPPSECGALPQA